MANVIPHKKTNSPNSLAPSNIGFLILLNKKSGILNITINAVKLIANLNKSSNPTNLEIIEPYSNVAPKIAIRIPKSIPTLTNFSKSIFDMINNTPLNNNTNPPKVVVNNIKFSGLIIFMINEPSINTPAETNTICINPSTASINPSRFLSPKNLEINIQIPPMVITKTPKVKVNVNKSVILTNVIAKAPIINTAADIIINLVNS